MACDISLLKNGRIYLCVDLKSFYASVECVERHLDPLTTNLAVADPERRFCICKKDYDKKSFRILQDKKAEIESGSR